MSHRINKTGKEKIESGRMVIDKYREDHRLLHANHKGGSPPDHSKIIQSLITGLKNHGYDDIEDFFKSNEEKNMEETEKTYIRTGSCNRCGKCCELEKCEHYKGDGVCDIYETRPEKCSLYPTIKSIKELPVECSYVFIRTQYKQEVDIEWS